MMVMCVVGHVTWINASPARLSKEYSVYFGEYILVFSIPAVATYAVCCVLCCVRAIEKS